MLPSAEVSVQLVGMLRLFLTDWVVREACTAVFLSIAEVAGIPLLLRLTLPIENDKRT